MGLIPAELINQIIQRVDIVELIGNYTALKKAGRNFKALCPFHNEKSPSFVVNPDKQIFHCFGCGVGGDALGFLMRQEHLEFPEAVRFLADKTGISIPEEHVPHQAGRQVRDEIFKINALATAFFHELFLNSRLDEVKAGRSYLKDRGVDIETVKKFQLGFAPNEWDALLKHLKSKGFSEALIEQSGLIVGREGKAGYYDRFRNRIIFPIHDTQGRPLAFGARAMGDAQGAKYINSPETPVYTKGQHLFGLHLTKNMVGAEDMLIVVEGYMDMIMPYIHGITHIAASLGTALTVNQVRLMRRYTHHVVMLFDGDPAGQAAIVRSLDLLIDEEMDIRVALLKPGDDPDSFIRKEGADAFKTRIASAVNVLDFKFNWLSQQHNPQTLEGKAKIAQELLAMIARFKSEVAKYELIKDLSRKLDVPQQVLLKQITGLKQSQSEPVFVDREIKALAWGSSGQELLLALFLKDAQWVSEAIDAVGPEDFKDSDQRRVVEAIWSRVKMGQAWTMNELLVCFQGEPGLQALVTRLSSVEEEKLGDAKQVFKDCIGKIQKEKQKRMRLELMAEMRQAELGNDTAKLDQLKEAFNRLLKNSC